MKKGIIVSLVCLAIVLWVFGQSFAKDLPAHNFPYGWCTWFVAQQTFIPFGGDAKNWLTNAESYKFKVYKGNSKAYKYAILATNESKWGHVAWITSVNGDDINIKEMNYKGFGIESSRTIKKGDAKIQGIILTKKAIHEKYYDGYTKYKKYKDDPKKYKKYKEYKDDYEDYKDLKKRYEDAGIWK